MGSVSGSGDFRYKGMSSAALLSVPDAMVSVLPATICAVCLSQCPGISLGPGTMLPRFPPHRDPGTWEF